MRIPTLETQRLRLEPLGPAHAPAYLDYVVRNREHLQPWEPLRGDRFFTREGVDEEIARIAVLQERGEAARFAAFERDTQYLAGVTGLWNIRRGVIHAATIGYSADAAVQGRGLTTEAAAAVIAWAFGELRLHRIETSYQPTNAASARVLRKLGFAVEGYARDYLYLNGSWTDGILVAKINDGWQAPERPHAFISPPHPNGATLDGAAELRYGLPITRRCSRRSPSR